MSWNDLLEVDVILKEKLNEKNSGSAAQQIYFIVCFKTSLPSSKFTHILICRYMQIPSESIKQGKKEEISKTMKEKTLCMAIMQQIRIENGAGNQFSTYRKWEF